MQLGGLLMLALSVKILRCQDPGSQAFGETAPETMLTLKSQVTARCSLLSLLLGITSCFLTP